jgi:hypothetical protein
MGALQGCAVRVHTHMCVWCGVCGWGGMSGVVCVSGCGGGIFCCCMWSALWTKHTTTLCKWRPLMLTQNTKVDSNDWLSVKRDAVISLYLC